MVKENVINYQKFSEVAHFLNDMDFKGSLKKDSLGPSQLSKFFKTERRKVT